MSSGGVGGGSSGQYTSQSFLMSSSMGSDGQMHTQHFASSEVGNCDQGIREAQQAYSDTASGLEKMAMERQLGERGMKIVRERDANTKEERSTELFQGMEETGREAFGQAFQAQAHHLPQHARFSPQALRYDGVGASALQQDTVGRV